MNGQMRTCWDKGGEKGKDPTRPHPASFGQLDEMHHPDPCVVVTVKKIILQGSYQMEGPIDPCLVQGDLEWADNDFVECVFEEFPFLREVEFKALPSPSDFFIFQSGNRVLGYYQEACTIYFLGHSLYEAHRGFEQIKRCGWGQSPFRRVDDQTGEVQDDGIGLGGQAVMIIKAPSEYKTVDDLCEVINQSIEENTLIWPNVKSTAMENARKEILQIPDLNGVQSITIFPAGYVNSYTSSKLLRGI